MVAMVTGASDGSRY